VVISVSLTAAAALCVVLVWAAVVCDVIRTSPSVQITTLIRFNMAHVPPLPDEKKQEACHALLDNLGEPAQHT
jgi:hypothetical protein